MEDKWFINQSPPRLIRRPFIRGPYFLVTNEIRPLFINLFITKWTPQWVEKFLSLKGNDLSDLNFWKSCHNFPNCFCYIVIPIYWYVVSEILTYIMKSCSFYYDYITLILLLSLLSSSLTENFRGTVLNITHGVYSTKWIKNTVSYSIDDDNGDKKFISFVSSTWLKPRSLELEKLKVLIYKTDHSSPQTKISLKLGS